MIKIILRMSNNWLSKEESLDLKAAIKIFTPKI